MHSYRNWSSPPTQPIHARSDQPDATTKFRCVTLARKIRGGCTRSNTHIALFSPLISFESAITGAVRDYKAGAYSKVVNTDVIKFIYCKIYMFYLSRTIWPRVHNSYSTLTMYLLNRKYFLRYVNFALLRVEHKKKSRDGKQKIFTWSTEIRHKMRIFDVFYTVVTHTLSFLCRFFLLWANMNVIICIQQHNIMDVTM
jgi:hypothetical protein